MSHIQYPVNGTFSQHLPGRLLYISSASYGRNWLSMPHSHSFTELFFVLTGKGSFCSENTKTAIQKDSLVIINPNIRHTEQSTASEPLTYMVLGIDNAKFEFSAEENAPFHIYDFACHRSSVLPLMEDMLKEARNKRDSSETICQHYFTILMLRIMRITNKTFTLATPKDIPPECESLKTYIDTHYRDPITLDTLSEISHLNKYYLAHIFSKTFGISPINYMLERRILSSKKLLENYDFTITHIAEASGFSSSNYFSQSFKKYAGMTPTDYRKKYGI